MKVIGFGFDKLHANRYDSYNGKSNKTTNIEITNVVKEDLPFNATDSESYRISFRFEINYFDAEAKKETKVGEVAIEGFINLLMEEDKAKDLVKSWKKKELVEGVKQPLFNLILRKCTTKALELEENVNLPSHIPIPQLRLGKKD